MEEEIIKRLTSKAMLFWQNAVAPDANEMDCLFTALAQQNEGEIDRLLVLREISVGD